VNDPVLQVARRIVTMTPDGGGPLLALDHDGTLSPIADRPEAARLAPGAAEALHRLAPLAEIVIVSGRGLDDLVARFDGLPVTLVAEHGLRLRRADGTIEMLTSGLAPAVLSDLRTDVARLLDGRDGWVVEDKEVTVAIHHRLVAAEDLQPTLARVHDQLEAAAALPGARRTGGVVHLPGGHVQTGKAVLELRPAGADKGAALRHVASGSGARPVVMVGDDVTDESALAVAESLGGVGILVAATGRATAASERLDDPDATVELLTRLADLLEDRSADRTP